MGSLMKGSQVLLRSLDCIPKLRGATKQGGGTVKICDL